MIKENREILKYENTEIQTRDEKILENLGLSFDEIRELKNSESGGTTSDVYIVGEEDNKFILKKGIVVDPDINSRREYTLLRLLNMRDGEKVAPEPYYLNKEHDILIMENVEGEEIVELTDKDIEDIARKLAFVHKPELTRPGLPFQERKVSTQYDRLLQ